MSQTPAHSHTDHRDGRACSATPAGTVETGACIADAPAADGPAPIPECPAGTPLETVLRATSPLVVRGLVAHWPAVRAAQHGPRAAAAYLRRFANDALPATAMTAPPDAHGRISYDETLQGFNFRQEQVPLSVALNTLVNYLDDDAAPMIYLGATTLDTFLPGLQAENALDLGARDPLASIWIGNRSRVPTHQDLPDNLACVVVGRRRVTLFPPDQLRNLYIGPLEFTPAGQPVSLVDPDAPDLQRFPRFAQAWRHALVAELGPGDAVLIPGMWWHHMAALDGFNVLVNYWWRDTPAWMASPVHALQLAMLTLRELPPHQRAIWREVFAHYVFDADGATAAHVPEAARGMLGPLDAATAERMLARLRKALGG